MPSEKGKGKNLSFSEVLETDIPPALSLEVSKGEQNSLLLELHEGLCPRDYRGTLSYLSLTVSFEIVISSTREKTMRLWVTLNNLLSITQLVRTKSLSDPKA